MAIKTVRDTITLAMKKLGLLRAGGVPAAADASDGLESLKSFYKEQITQGAFGRVRSVIATADVTAEVGQHVANTGSTPITVTLPTEGAWWWYEATTPADLSVVVSTDLTDVRATHLYDAQIQRWIDLEALDLDSEAPLSSRGFDGLASVLALRISDQFGSEVPIATVRSANSFKLALVSRHGVEDNEHPCWPRYYDYGFPGTFY